jgi:preprotein translocase subunit SecE
MAMNREMKRMLQRQGTLGTDGAPAPRQRQKPPAAARQQQQQKEKRTSLPQFLREVMGELRKVAWPTRSEVINYSIIVLIAVVLLTAFVASLDWIFGQFVLKLFNQ